MEAPPQSEDMAKGPEVAPGRMTAVERSAYDAPLDAYGEQSQNFASRFYGGVAGFINGLGGYGDGMKKISGFVSETSQAGKTDQQRMLTRLFAPDSAEIDARPQFQPRVGPQLLTFARKRFVESRTEFAKFKGGFACDLNFSKLWGSKGESTSGKTEPPPPVRYGLVLREIKIEEGEQHLAASGAPIDGDDLMNATKPKVVWGVGPLPSESNEGALRVSLDEMALHDSLWEQVDWSYYRPDFGMRLVPRDGLEANTGSLPSGKPVKLITEQKRGFYRMEMDSLDPNLIHHFFAVPLYQKLNVAYVFNKDFIEEKISLLNLLAVADRPTVNVHYLCKDERFKSEVRAGVGPYALSFGSDTSKRLAEKDAKTKYEMGLSRDF